MSATSRIQLFLVLMIAQFNAVAGAENAPTTPAAASEPVTAEPTTAVENKPEQVDPNGDDKGAEEKSMTEPGAATTTESMPQSRSETDIATESTTVASVTAAPTTAADSHKYEKHAFILTYDMAVPVGNTWQYVGAFSPAGCTFDYRYHFTPRLAVGAVIGWNSFDIKERGTFVYDNVTVTGTQIRSLDVMHFGANFHANLLPIASRFVPFVGMDIAAYRTWRVTDFGWWTAGQNDWHFGFAPALGVLLHLPGITVILGSKFQMAVKTSNAESETYVSFNIGVGLD